MKRITLSLGLLAVIFALCLTGTQHLKGITVAVTHQLEQAEASAESGDWTTALTYTQQAQAKWDSHTAFLYALLRHEEVDKVLQGFREVTEFISCQESGEYSAANARLMAQIQLLYEMEQLSWANLL